MKIGKYTKKPVTIEAVQLHISNITQVMEWSGARFFHTESPMRAITGVCINTLEGTMVANFGDWIIKGVKGEFYPCKPDIFEASYTCDNNDVWPEHVLKRVMTQEEFDENYKQEVILEGPKG